MKLSQAKEVIVNYWACQRELPVLAQIYRRFKDKGVEVLAIFD